MKKYKQLKRSKKYSATVKDLILFLEQFPQHYEVKTCRAIISEIYGAYELGEFNTNKSCIILCCDSDDGWGLPQSLNDT